MIEYTPEVDERSDLGPLATLETAEASCCHAECNQAFVDEINRPDGQGWDAEDLCVIREREADAQYFEAEFRSIDHQIEGDRR